MKSKDEDKIVRLYEYIQQYQYDNNSSPTTMEMKVAMEMSSKDIVNRYVTELVERGLLKKNDLTSRNIDIINPIQKSEFTSSKIVGSISCGIPSEELENDAGDEVLLPKALFGDGECYILTANGDSMINAGINDGDMLVVRKAIEAKNGDIVVALVDDHENTLKRYVKDGDTIKLVAENDRYADIYPQTLNVQGVLAYCIKAYE